VRATGAEPGSLTVSAVRVAHALAGLAAVVVTARIAWRLAGPFAARAAAFLVAVNPIFAQYSVEPLVDTPAMLLCALGVEAALERGGFRRGLAVGLWLGLACVVAFKSIPVAAVVGAMVVLRDSWRRPAMSAGLAAAAAGVLALQAAVDGLVFGTFGGALGAYLLENVGQLVARWIYLAGFEELAISIYNRLPHVGDVNEANQAARGALRSLRDTWFYWRRLDVDFLCWPAAASTAAGLAWLAWQRRFGGLLLVALVVADAVLLSSKASKDWRLWLPVLPALASAGGVALAAAAGPRGGCVRRTLALGILALAGAQGARMVLAANAGKYGAYWRAVESVQAAARREPPATALRLASAYNWAVQYRAEPPVELVKLPHPIDRWPVLGEPERAEILAALETVDWYVGHQQTLDQDARLMELANRRFALHEAHYEAATFEELKPVLVLCPRRAGLETGEPAGAAAGAAGPRQRTFFELFTGIDPGAYQAALPRPASVDFRRREADGAGESVQQIVLLGWELEPGEARGELAWITYHWFCGTPLARDYTVVDRLDDQVGHQWQNNHAPAYGALPTSTWQPGWIVRETYLVTLPPDPRRFGGEWARGDLVPVELYVGIAAYDESGAVVGGLNPFRPSGAAPYPKKVESGRVVGGEGRRFSPDGLFLVGGARVPVAEHGRLADDGTPFVESSAPDER
jgi:hypothetical protein